ncbi:cell division protein ZapA [bacterium]|nr:cell division protein ZapA [bacterium]
MQKIRINIGGEQFTLETDTPEKVKNIEKFIHEKIENASKATGLNDTRKNLTFAFLSVVVEMWDNVKETFGVDDGQETAKYRIEVLNTKIKEKIEELNDGLD